MRPINSAQVRADLRGGIKFQSYLYSNKGHLDYGYQIFGKAALARWDNKEEFADVSTFPHHHHNLNAEIVASALTGNPEIDLPQILEWLKQHFDQIREANK